MVCILTIAVNLMDGRFENGDAALAIKMKPDGPKCKVCDDKASGYHYGVTSCEGCKVRKERERESVGGS